VERPTRIEDSLGPEKVLEGVQASCKAKAISNYPAKLLCENLERLSYPDFLIDLKKLRVRSLRPKNVFNDTRKTRGYEAGDEMMVTLGDI
jgi:hypothetical protein